MWVTVCSFLHYEDVTHIEEVNKELNALCTKWTNTIWQTQCFHLKYINDLTKISPVVPWKEVHAKIPLMYEWKIGSLALQTTFRNLPGEVRKLIQQEFNRFTDPVCRTKWVETVWKHSVTQDGYKCDVYKYVHDYQYARENTINEDIYFCIYRSMVTENFSFMIRVETSDIKASIENPVTGQFRVLFVMENGSILLNETFTYKLSGYGEELDYDVSHHIPSLIEHGILTETGPATFTLKPMKCIFIYDW